MNELLVLQCHTYNHWSDTLLRQFHRNPTLLSQLEPQEFPRVNPNRVIFHQQNFHQQNWNIPKVGAGASLQKFTG